MLKDQGDCVLKACQAFFACRALAIGTRNFGAICNVPLAINFNYCRKFVAHVCILPLDEFAVGYGHPAGVVDAIGKLRHLHPEVTTTFMATILGTFVWTP